MEFFNEYRGLATDHKDLIKMINDTNSQVLLTLGDCFKTMEYLYNKNADGVKLTDEQKEVFDIGYDYLSEFLYDLDVYYNDYFKKDSFLFNQYATLINFQILFTDVLYYYKTKPKTSKDKIDQINNILMDIDNRMVNLKGYDQMYKRQLDYDMMKLKPTGNDFCLTYEIFMSAVEELDIN